MEAALRCFILLLGVFLAVSSREPRRDSLHEYVRPGLDGPSEALAAVRRSRHRLRQFSRNASFVAGGAANVAGQEPQEEEVTNDDLKRAILEGDKEAAEELRKRTRKSADEVRHLPDAMRDMVKSNREQMEYLLPGLQARTSSLVTLPITVACGFVWLCIYFRFGYVLDHEEYLMKHSDHMHAVKSTDYGTSKDSADPEGGQGDEESEEMDWEDAAHAEQLERDEDTTNRLHVHADMVFVFHHPRHPYSDRDTHLTADVVKSVIAARQASGFFVEFERVITEHEKQKREASIAEKSKSKIKGLVRGEVLEMTMGQARTLVLKDMVRSLPLMGFNVAVFTSVDDDELFLCVSLSRPEVIKHYLQRENKELQTTPAVVERLKIKQNPRDPCSSPPFVRYDLRIVQALHGADVIDENDEKLLYRVYHDRDHEGSIMSSRERIRVIQRELTRYLNIAAAEETGVLKTWYPCHSELWLHKLRAEWSSWDRMKDLTFHQPIPLLREYFGSQLAFNFAWQGVWCKGLSCLAVAAIIVTIVKFGPTAVLGYALVPEKQIMPFAIIILMWAKVMTNLWLREEEYFRSLWNQETIDDQITRPSFKGIMMQSEVDENLMEEGVKKSDAVGLRVISVCITLFCCALVMAITGAWVHVHEGDLDLISSLWLTIMVKVFEFLYNMLSAKLVEMENHKYDQDFHDAWVWQQFLFQAVNNYWACISIAFSQKVSGKCPEIGCFQSLQNQVSMLVVILLACSIAILLAERVQVWFTIWLEDYNLEKKGDKDPAAETSRSFLEEQSKYTIFDMRAQIENMLQLVIGLGFVLLFGTLQPLVVPLCFLHFLCAMRFRAALLTWFARRVLPHKLRGVGAWGEVMSVLMNLSVFFSGVLIVCWGRFFKDTKLLARLTGLIVWILLINSMWALVDIICPPKSKEAQIMLKRRNYAGRVLIEASMDTRVAAEGVADEELHSEISAEGSHEASPAKGQRDEAEQASYGSPRTGGSESARLVVDEAPSSSAAASPPARKVSIMESPRAHSKSSSGKKSHGDQLVFTDALSHRAMRLQLDCDVEELVPQGPVVHEEQWENIPRLSGKLYSARPARKISKSSAGTRC